MKKIIAAIMLCSAWLAMACGSGVQDVTYMVTGDAGKVKVQATVENGKVFKDSGLSLPWEKSFTSNRKMDLFLTVTSENDGAFTASISVDGVVVTEKSGSKAGDELSLEYLSPSP